MKAIINLLLAPLFIFWGVESYTQVDSTAANPTNSVFSDQEVWIPTDSGKLAGTLSLPEKDTIAVVLIIAGSGPTDRNGNGSNSKNNSLKYLSDTLSANRISVLRYDKRGIAASKEAGKPEKDMRFDDMINDAESCLNWLSLNFPGIPQIVIGHSEGALVGIIAAKNQNVDAYISICGPAFSADSILKQQLYARSPLLGDYCAPKLDSIKNGYLVKEKNPMLQAILRESVQPYLRSWMTYDPQKELKDLKMPALFIGGAKDIQVPAEHAQILADEHKSGKAVIIEDMNHILKKISGNRMMNTLSYNKPEIPLHPALSTNILQFIQQNISN